jgi:hypothetical protein
LSFTLIAKAGDPRLFHCTASEPFAMRESRKKLRVDKTQIGAHDAEEHKRHRKNKPAEKTQTEADEDRGRILPRQWIALEPTQCSGDLHRTRILTWNVSSLTIA